MDRWERDRQEREKAWGDAVYDVWRAGGNPDAVSREAIDDAYYECYDREQAAKAVVNKALQKGNH